VTDSVPPDQSQQNAASFDALQDDGYISDPISGGVQLPGMFSQFKEPGQVLQQPVDERGALAMAGIPPWMPENPVLAHPKRGRGRYQNRGLTDQPDETGNPLLQAEQKRGIFTTTDPREQGTMIPGTLPG
jgi:hypothetical protein